MRGDAGESLTRDDTFQSHGGIFIMKADGTDKRQLTDSPWEDVSPRVVSKPGRYATRAGP